MIMYSVILLLIIALAAVGYCLRDSRAATERFKLFARGSAEAVLELEENSRRDAEIIKQLTWERDAAHFMLETVVNELPDEHYIPKATRPAVTSSSIREQAIRTNRRAWPSGGDEIPEQREPSDLGSRTHLKEHS